MPSGLRRHTSSTPKAVVRRQWTVLSISGDAEPRSLIRASCRPSANGVDALLAQRAAEVALKERRTLLQNVAKWVHAGNVQCMDSDLTSRFGKLMQSAFVVTDRVHTHSRRLTTYHNCFSWESAVDWLLAKSVALDLDQAFGVLVHLSSCRVIESVPSPRSIMCTLSFRGEPFD